VRRRRFPSSLLATVIALAVPSQSKAASLRVERAAGAEACPDPASFETRAREGATVRDRDMTVRFQKTRNGYASAIRTSDGMTRALEDPTCDALADATLVVVRLALEDDSPSPPAPAPARGAEDGRAPATAVEDADGRDRPARDPSKTPAASLEIAAGPAAASGLGGSFAPGVRVGAGWTFGGRHWALGLTGLALAPQTHPVEQGSVEISVLGGGVEGCRRAATERESFAVALCARAELFALAGAAQGFARNESHTRPLATAGLVLRGRAAIAGPLGWFAEMGAMVPLAREQFAIDGAGVIYDPPAVALAGATGPSLDFW
jgi:hypothetical protein